MHIALALLLLLLSGGPQVAEAGDHYRYRIRHAVFGEIGQHQVGVRYEGRRVVVEHATQLRVRLLGITAHEREFRCTEVWQGERLIAFEALTIDNGERFEVKAQAVGDHLMIDSAAGRIMAPADTVPSQPALERAASRSVVFDVRTGETLAATTRFAGREWLKLGSGAPVETTRYETTGELEQTVWYDTNGLFARWRLWRQGAAITLTRD
jgi:hypothetical protein